jgi:CsoR family transcriptional regulator, copper-sensing transcriptional repressor
MQRSPIRPWIRRLRHLHPEVGGRPRGQDPRTRPGPMSKNESSPPRAAGVVPEIRDANLNRLRRIEGQVRGIQKMIEEDRYCPDILVQIASVREALMGVSRELMRNHLTHCAARATREGGDAEEAMRGELLDLIFRYLR